LAFLAPRTHMARLCRGPPDSLGLFGGLGLLLCVLIQCSWVDHLLCGPNMESGSALIGPLRPETALRVLPDG
jgi:hypothetical protein